jgi:transposase
MPLFVGLDASRDNTSICIIDEEGRRVREGATPTSPMAIADFLNSEHGGYARIGIEPMPFTRWLYEGLAPAGLPLICIDATQAHKVMRAGKLNKTDKNDARGIAELMRNGLYKTVHLKTQLSQSYKLLLTARKCMVSKRVDVDNLLAELLVQFGIKLRRSRAKGFADEVAKVAPEGPIVRTVIDALVAVRGALISQVKELERAIVRLSREDEVCRRLCTAPGVGPLTAVAYRSAIDIPERFRRSRDVGVHLGLTPATRQSGTRERRGRISKCGDAGTRTALFQAAFNLIRVRRRATQLGDWGRDLVARKGRRKATVAVARRLAVILHRMWITQTDFCELG